jgi:hypothetical protein
MFHDLVFALCSLALLLGTVWLLIGLTHHSHDVMFSGHTILHPMGQNFHANVDGAGVKLGGPASSGSSVGGWSRIRRAMRARDREVSERTSA